ncbi:MAG TPA: vWA domain-containing protein [Pseudomonadales bacterium]
MSLEFDQPWALLLLPLCLIPLLASPRPPVRYSSLLLIPADPASRVLEVGLRLVAAATIALVVLGLGDPYRPGAPIERVARGAEIVLLLDRSRSMDQPFGGQPFTNPLEFGNADSKGTIARRVLSEFVAARRHDQYAMLVFSTHPLQVLPLTDKPAPIQAAITAGNVGRGLTDTDVGSGILAAARLFDDRPYTGSRLVLLISDGGARLDLAAREAIAHALKRNRVALYWIYISSRNAPAIGAADDGRVGDELAPARTLHRFFGTLETPYRLFDVEDPTALETAIAEVDRLQSLPIRRLDRLPRTSVAGVCYLLALLLLSVSTIAQAVEKTRWSADAATG